MFPRRRYIPGMNRTRNLADPDYEPTDEDLAELMRSAFAGLKEAREESLREMRARIARMSEEVLRGAKPGGSEG